MDPLLEDYTYYPIENEIPTIPENNSRGNTTGGSAALSDIWPVIDNEDKVVISADCPHLFGKMGYCNMTVFKQYAVLSSLLK